MLTTEVLSSAPHIYACLADIRAYLLHHPCYVKSYLKLQK